MNEQVKARLARYPEAIGALFSQLRGLVMESHAPAPEERLWAGMPSYYVGEAFVRLIPCKDHVNIEAAAILRHQAALTSLHLTPKGMLQIGLDDELPEALLRPIFHETLAQADR